MKKPFTRSFVRALIITIVSALIIVGGIYAYETFWTGEAHITIELPDENGESDLEVSNVSTNKGMFEDGVWTVTLEEWYETATLSVEIQNFGSGHATIELLVNGKGGSPHQYPAPGVSVYSGYSSEVTIPPGQSYVATFHIYTDITAQSGTLPDVLFEIREKI